MAEKDKKSSASFVPFRPLDNLFEPTVPEQPAPAKSGYDFHHDYNVSSQHQAYLRGT